MKHGVESMVTVYVWPAGTAPKGIRRLSQQSLHSVLLGQSSYVNVAVVTVGDISTLFFDVAKVNNSEMKIICHLKLQTLQPNLMLIVIKQSIGKCWFIGVLRCYRGCRKVGRWSFLERLLMLNSFN